MFMKKREDELYTIKTRYGKFIKVSADHPLYTPKGMKCAYELKEGDNIVTYPFSGVKYEQPSDEIIATIDDVANYLDKIGITNKGNAKIQILNRLKELNLLPLRFSSPQLPIIIKIMGFVFGDGVLTFLKNKKGFVHFYGDEENLELIRKDLIKIGITAQNIFKRKRSHKIKTQYSLVEFDFEEKSLIKKSAGFAALLAILGVPVGKKTHTNYRIPNWLKRAERWQKRLFLASFFGAELSKPKTLNKYNFYCPQLNMNKSEYLIENGIDFLNDVREMLNYFGVEANEPVLVHGNDYEGVYGKTRGLRLLIKSNQENLIKLYELVGYEYNIQKQKLACLAIDYIKLKKKIRESSYNPLIITANGLLLKKRVTGNFISFEDFIKRKAFGNHGLVLDKIDKIEKERYNGYVYDFTVNHKDHNFIANNIISSNCGMRLVTTNLTIKEVQPKLKPLIDELFRTVPAGVGSKGFVKPNVQQLKEVMEDGAKWCVENGYGWKEDLERSEGYGKIEWADSSKVSDRAIQRGISQLGTLGSGNHYLEVQLTHASNIFDEDIAKKFGIYLPNQVVIMLHCGSRGLGHQIATDYLKVFDTAMKKYNIKVVDRELACAPFSSKEGQDYYKAMACAANFAFANRQVILHRIREGFSKIFNKSAEDLEINLVYDVAHNIAKVEEHQVNGKKKKLVVHRKGSTRAFGPGHPELAKQFQETGQPVIVGGSMETGSYLLAGTKKAEEETFGSTCFSKDTKILTDKGLMTIQEIYNKFNEDEEIFALSVNEENMKAEWKKIENVMKRKGNLIRVSISQRGLKKTNNLDLTPDHKILTFDGLELVEKRIIDIINNNEMVCVLDKIPQFPKNFYLNYLEDKKLPYISGSIFSDGYIRYNYRHGQVSFIQKPTQEKQAFIETITTYFNDYFGTPFNDKGPKGFSGGIINGRQIIGNANEFRCSQQLPAKTLLNIKNNISKIILIEKEEFVKNYLAGIIDGDGASNKKRNVIHIYSGKEKIYESIILGCLRLGIVPYISKNRENCLNIQIAEKTTILTEKTKRVKIIDKKRKYGTKVYAAKQLFGFRKFKWPFKHKVLRNNLMSKDYILKHLRQFNENEKNKLNIILNSDLRMQRVKKIKNIGNEDVYNITVADNHNYIVFTKFFTPILVKNCHGSGRTMSRTKAKSLVRGDKLQKDMQQHGIYIRAVSMAGLAEEAGIAYKNISDVIDSVHEAGISKKIVALKPIGNIKG